MKEPALYCCDNPKCSRGGVATESAWQELIRKRKALEIALNCLNGVGKELPWVKRTLDEITALEQKDK